VFLLRALERLRTPQAQAVLIELSADSLLAIEVQEILRRQRSGRRGRSKR